MFNFERFFRKARKAIRARYHFLLGALSALRHLRDWAKHQKTMMEEHEQQAQELFGSSSDNGVYLAVGTALTSWATMEQSIVFIAANLLRTDPEKAGLVLYSIINFSVWLSIVDELFAIDPMFSPLKPKWNKLAERLRQLKDDRDRIAHHAAHKPDVDASAFAETSLRPSELDLRRKSQKHKPMTNDDIFVFGTKVSLLAKDLLALATLMIDEHRARLRKSEERGTDPHPTDIESPHFPKAH